jgi:Peptidase family M28
VTTEATTGARFGTQSLQALVAELSAIERPSASSGERAAAEWIVDRFAEIGVEARIETERVHGTYWWPLGVSAAAGALGGALALRGRRGTGAAIAGLASAAIWDDLTSGEHYLRRLLPQRDTHHVVAEIGPADAKRTLVFVAHHDAAHQGLIFHPGIPAFVWRRFPALIERNDTSPPLMFPVFAGPALAALGALTGSKWLSRIGVGLGAGTVPVMTDIGVRRSVPGANDNATAVVALLAIARALIAAPTSNLRVVLLSTGSEESISEGMHAFMKRHAHELPRESTFFFCLDTLGSPHLTVIRGEGMLRMFEYPRPALDLVDLLAAQLGIWLFPNLRLRNGTDGLYPLRYGYQCASLGSVTEYKAPANYHWPSDTADNVNYATMRDAIRLSEALLRRLDERWL